jgi:hypothetical protein
VVQILEVCTLDMVLCVLVVDHGKFLAIVYVVDRAVHLHLSPLVLVAGPGFLLYARDGWWLGEFGSLLLAADLHRTGFPRRLSLAFMRHPTLLNRKMHQKKATKVDGLVDLSF